MRKKDRELVCDRIENEGFDYCFMCYSDFPEVHDEEFHRLRELYRGARQALAQYVEYEN